MYLRIICTKAKHLLYESWIHVTPIQTYPVQCASPIQCGTKSPQDDPSGRELQARE